MTIKPIILLIISHALFAAPSVYQILKLPANTAPVIDGNITEWPEAYFIDSIRSDDNVYARDGDVPWSPGEFQMRLSAAYDDTFLYFAVKVTADDDYIIGSGWGADNLRILPGGFATSFYVNSIDEYVGSSQSSPFQYGSTLWWHTQTRCSDSLPSYEVKIVRWIYAPFQQGVFRSSIGTEDIDSGNQFFFLGIGAEYKGPKADWDGNPWDNLDYYPTYILSENMGPAPAVEPHKTAQKVLEPLLFENTPNPCTGRTIIRFSLPQTQRVEISIVNIQGQCVRTLINKAQDPGYHRVIFDGLSQDGNALSSGIYLCRMKAGFFSKTRALILQ